MTPIPSLVSERYGSLSFLVRHGVSSFTLLVLSVTSYWPPCLLVVKPSTFVFSLLRVLPLVVHGRNGDVQNLCFFVGDEVLKQIDTCREVLPSPASDSILVLT